VDSILKGVKREDKARKDKGETEIPWGIGEQTRLLQRRTRLLDNSGKREEEIGIKRTETFTLTIRKRVRKRASVPGG